MMVRKLQDSAGCDPTGRIIRDSVRPVLGALLAAVLAGSVFPAGAADLPGVTPTEIKIGNTDAYSGPASAYGVIAKAETAFFKMVNDQGGVAGHKINFIS